MPGSSTNLGLSLPLGGDAPSQLRLSLTANANSLDAYLLLTSVVTNVASAGVLRGQSVIASPSTTQTLPAASANAMVAVTASSTVTGAAPVTVAGSNIYGVGLSAASSFKLGTPGACVVLQSDGTNWFVIAGQQDTGWVALTLATNIIAGDSFTPAGRLGGDVVRLRGAINNFGTSKAPGATLFTLPAGLRPSSTISIAPAVVIGTTGTDVLSATSAGVVTAPRLNMAGGDTIALHGVTFTLS